LKQHSDEQCREKLLVIIDFLDEIQEILEYPRSDREVFIRHHLDKALQDLNYLNSEVEPGYWQ